MVMMLNGEPLHVPLAEFTTRDECEEMREHVMLEMLRNYPTTDEDLQARYYCERRITAEA